MSYEAWGEPDDRDVPEGWWPDETVEVVQQCIRELVGETLYEGGKKENGISVRFLARLTILQGEAGLIPTDGPLYREAEAMFAADTVSGGLSPQNNRSDEK